MKFSVVSAGAAAALVLTLSFSASSARADDTDDCNDIIAALMKRGETVMKSDAKTPAAVCAAQGQALGMMESVRIVAEECYEETNKKRAEIIKDMEESGKVMQDEIASKCK
jgi:hypothetical protein